MASRDQPQLLGVLDRALAVPGPLLARAEARWADPSGCDGWSVRDLAVHLIGGDRLFARAVVEAASAAGTAPVRSRAGALELVEALGAFDTTDPAAGAAAHRVAEQELRAAFAAPGALERTVAVPFGTVPASVALWLRVIESVVHGWDLARATDQEPNVPEDLAAAALEFTEGMLPSLPTERSPFAPPRPVEASAPPLGRLVALLGRDPGAAGGLSVH